MRDEHACTPPEENPTSAEPIQGPQAGPNADELRHVKYAGHDDLHVVIESHGTKKSWRVVDQSINTDKLSSRVRIQHLQGSWIKGAFQGYGMDRD